MVRLVALSTHPGLTSAAQEIFRDYAAFLRQIQACHAFNFTRFDEEIRTLPIAYTEAHGDLLLALNPAAPADPPAPTEAVPVGVVAFRAAPPVAEPGACEIKRLFVRPEARSQGIAEQLVRAALQHASNLGYRSAILDTEPSTMAAAQALYRKLGFTPYTPAHPHNPVDVIYLRRSLP